MSGIKQGIYESIINNKILKEINDETLLVEKDKLNAEDAKLILTEYISDVTRTALKYMRDNTSEEDEYLIKQIKVCNEIIDLLKNELNDEEFEDLKISESAEVLTSVYSKINNTSYTNKVVRPETSIARTSLFTGSRREPNLNEELKREIQSSDEICMLVSFIRWSGLRTILDELREFTNKGKKLRIITTSYMSATQPKAVIELAKLNNTEVKVSYDVERTRLHAKAYIFKRDNGFFLNGTAFYNRTYGKNK
jgi:HKD family nuclease